MKYRSILCGSDICITSTKTKQEMVAEFSECEMLYLVSSSCCLPGTSLPWFKCRMERYTWNCNSDEFIYTLKPCVKLQMCGFRNEDCDCNHLISNGIKNYAKSISVDFVQKLFTLCYHRYQPNIFRHLSDIFSEVSIVSHL